MTQVLSALQLAVAAALVLLGVIAIAAWVRQRGRSRLFLALSIAQLGVIAALGRVSIPHALQAAWTVVAITLLMGSAYALLLFRHSLVPVRIRWLRVAAVLTVAVTAAAIVVNLRTPQTTQRAMGVALVVDVALLASWCLIVALSIQKLWRVSGRLAAVQRARLRSLNMAFTGLIVALLVSILTTAEAENAVTQIVIEAVVLLSVPWLGVSIAPPAWLRRTWREREEVPYRLAMNNLLLYSPDEVTLAQRVLEWGARLLGGRGALIVLGGEVLAFEGIAEEHALRIRDELSSVARSTALAVGTSAGPVAMVPLHSAAGDGYFAVIGGPITPLFGEEEMARLNQFGTSVTLALDRVHLTVSMRRNAELLDLAYDAVLTWEWSTRRIIYWNRSAVELYGYTAEEAIGQEPQSLLQSDYRVPLDGIVEALRSQGHWEGEFEQRTKDGRAITVSARWAVQRNAAGDPEAVLEINRDISAQKQAAEELRTARDVAEEASSAKSEYLSRMSHELRTPLASMLGFSDLLEMRDPREDQRHAIEAIQRAGSHLLSLVNDVLDIARIEAGRETLVLQALNVRAALHECCALVTQSANERGIGVTVRVDDEPLFVRADRQRLNQVLLNLLSNAVKYGAENGVISVTARRTSIFVEITVQDDGPGLSPAQQARLFQPFERLGAERSHVPGTGLGLALARQLTVAMGGALSVVSAPGEGSAFTIRLHEALESEAETVVAAAGPAVLRDAAQARSVLYVEDNLATISLVESIFALRPNIRLLTAMQGRLAIELAREHRPDLILLDLHLPDLDGDEILQRLRNDPRTADIPVVMYTADATERQVRRLLEAGAAAYLTKPARVQEFLVTIDGILNEQVPVRRGA